MSEVKDDPDSQPLPRLESRKRKFGGSGEYYYQAIEQSRLPHSECSSGEYNHPILYDHTSSISLVHQTLEDFLRTNAQFPESAPPSPAPRPEDHLASLPLRRGEVSAELQRFARVGGPDLTDLRSYTDPTSDKAKDPSDQGVDMPRSSKKSGEGSTNTNVGPYIGEFEHRLASHNIFMPARSPRPNNYQYLLRVLERPLSAPENRNHVQTNVEPYANFEEALDNAANESTVRTDVFPFIRGTKFYPNQSDQLCNNWARLFDEELYDKIAMTRAKPDYYDGLFQTDVDKRLRKYLNPYIVPSKDAPHLPNFFVEVKGPGGKPRIAKRQAMHDGTLGARGMYHTREIAGQNQLDGNAVTFSVTFYYRHLELYAHFITKPSPTSDELHYHMFLIQEYLVTKEYAAAVTAFRNLREHAYQVRGDLRDAAEARLRQLASQGQLSPPLPALPPPPTPPASEAAD